MVTKTTIAALCLLPAIPHASAAPKVVVKVRSLQVDSPETRECGFVGDAMRVEITDGGDLILGYNFCSAYGRAAARLATDSQRRTYLLLEHSEGHGTHATTKYLTVSRLEDHEISELVRLPINWAVGPSANFTYDYSVHADQSGGIQITLHGTVSGRNSDCCVPPETSMVLRIGPIKPVK